MSCQQVRPAMSEMCKLVLIQLTHKFWWFLEAEFRDVAIKKANHSHGREDADQDAGQQMHREGCEIDSLEEYMYHRDC